MDAYLYFEKHNDAKNQHRFYAMSIDRNLFGGGSLVRRWGRIGNRGGRQRIDLYDDLETAEGLFQKKEREKLRRGYQRAGAV